MRLFVVKTNAHGTSRCSYVVIFVSFAVAICSMKKILIVFHSKTGGAHQMAESAAKGAASEPVVHVNLIHANEAGPDELLEADGYIFATPENLAMMSGMMKDFFDRTYYAALDRIAGRPYAILICAGSDAENAARQIQRIATGWRRKAISKPIIVCTHAQTAEAILAPKQIGAFEPESLRRDGRHSSGGLSSRHLLACRFGVSGCAFNLDSAVELECG